MAGPKFDVSTPKGLGAFNGFMGSKSYVEGWSYSPADSAFFSKFSSCPAADKHPHAYRWYVHIAALQGLNTLSLAPPPAAAAAPAPAAPAKKETKKAAADDDDDDFDVFGDDDEEEEEPKESRAEMLARLKKEAEARTAAKEAKQRTLVSIEVKPWDTEQDLMELWKKITTTIKQDGLKWGEGCTLADVAYGIKKITTTIKQDGLKWGEGCTLVEVAYGIKKICTTFVMGVNNSSDDVVEAIQEMEDEVQSVEVTSMNVL